MSWETLTNVGLAVLTVILGWVGKYVGKLNTRIDSLEKRSTDLEAKATAADILASHFGEWLGRVEAKIDQVLLRQ